MELLWTDQEGAREATMTAMEEFERLCLPASLAELGRLKLRLATHVDLVAEAALRDPDLAVGLAGVLAGKLRVLADGALGMTAEQRSLVRGAIMYFIITSDADNDVAGPRGLDDDRDVFNEVCRRLGREDLVIRT